MNNYSNNNNVWEFIIDKFSQDIPVILLYVLHSEGSSPGRQGFKMAVAGDTHFCGTIGGGIMEHKFVEMAKDRLSKHFEEAGVYIQNHDKISGKNQSGMICSGEQTIFIYRIKIEDIDHIQKLIASGKEYRNGTLQLQKSGLKFYEDVPKKNFEYNFHEEEFILNEKTGFKNVLHIVGGGHCSLALSRIMSNMDFLITVHEERANLNTMEENIFAHQIKILTSFSELQSEIIEGENVYVVIMTFGYRTDDMALRAIVQKKLKYIGVLGSGKKMEKLFNDYKEENFGNELLEKLHTPVGLSINSKTSAEIAVSIAAEIISIKNAND